MISLIWRELSYMHNKEKYYSLIINLYAEMNRENNGVNNLRAVISLFCLLPDRCLFFYCKGISYLHNEFLICKKERTSK